MTRAADLHAIAGRFRDLARTEANGPLRKRLVDWAWRCDRMAKALDAVAPAPHGHGDMEPNAAEAG